jgi:hypothetical protein
MMTHEENNEYRVMLEEEARRVLEEEFHQHVPPSVPVSYFLSYKTEGRLASLREALDRIEAGTFGYCLLCRCKIAEKFLRKNPTTRLCLYCALGREWGSEKDLDVLWKMINSYTGPDSTE